MHRFYRRGRGEGKLNPAERNGIYIERAASIRCGCEGGNGVWRLLGEQVDVEGEWRCRIDSSLVLAIRERFVGGWGGFDLAALDCTLGAGKANEQRTRRLLDVELYFIFLSFRLEKVSFLKIFSVL